MAKIPDYQRLVSSALIIGILLAVCGSAVGAVLDVPREHHNLADAVAAARPGDVIEIRPGVYDTRDLLMPAGVTVRGLGETAGDVVLDGGGTDRIMTCRNLTAPVVIQNVTFRGGRAVGESVNLSSGGALFIINSEVYVQNCVFTGNEADAHGGAVRCVDSPARFSQCVFTDNTAIDGGGAIDVSYGSSPSFQGCVISDNRAAWGGGVSSRGGAEPVFTGCRFTANEATAALGFGGAVYADFTAAPDFEGCTFHLNRARYGGAIGSFQGSGIKVERSTFVRNTSGVDGGGIFSIGSAPRITSSIIAEHDGSGITVGDNAVPLVQCAGFYDNTQGDVSGGALDPASTDLLQGNPEFCANTDDLGTRFPLSDTSPYANTNCGLLGAWPVSCDREPAPVTDFQSTRTGSQLVVRWRADEDPYNQRYRLTWSTDVTEREVLFAQTTNDGFSGVAVLPDVKVGELRVRLYVQDSGTWLLIEDTGDGGIVEIPNARALTLQAWPNPFNPQTTISYTVPRTQRVRVTVHNLDGSLVRVLADVTVFEGPHEETWNGRDDAGRTVAAGVYVVMARGEDLAAQRKITLIK